MQRVDSYYINFKYLYKDSLVIFVVKILYNLYNIIENTQFYGIKIKLFLLIVSNCILPMNLHINLDALNLYSIKQYLSLSYKYRNKNYNDYCSLCTN